MRKKAIELTTTWNKDLTAGDAIEGVYVKKEVVDGNYGPQDKYIIETPDGERKGIFATASLTRQFKNIPEGSYVWVVYKGEVTTKLGRTIKSYEVDYDDDFTK